MRVWLARNCKSLHREVSNWQVANTWRLFLHTHGLCEYSFFKLLTWEQDLSTTTVFLSPSEPCWLTPAQTDWKLEAWSDCGPFRTPCHQTGIQERFKGRHKRAMAGVQLPQQTPETVKTWDLWWMYWQQGQLWLELTAMGYFSCGTG